MGGPVEIFDYGNILFEKEVDRLQPLFIIPESQMEQKPYVDCIDKGANDVVSRENKPSKDFSVIGQTQGAGFVHGQTQDAGFVHRQGQDSFLVKAFEEKGRGVYDKERVRRPRMEKVRITLPDYIRNFTHKKTRSSIYNQVTSGKFPFPVYIHENRGRKHYFVEIADPGMIKILKILKKKMNGENIISIDVKVPQKIIKAINLVSSPDSYDYKHFHKFIGEEVIKGKLNNVSTTIQVGPLMYQKEHIRILKKDYRRLKQISDFSNLSISKTLTMLFKAYLMLNYPQNFLKGGEDGNMLSTC